MPRAGDVQDGWDLFFAVPGGAEGAPELKIPVEQLPRHAPAWATTVHGAQGSEFERVLLLLPEEVPRALSRELLYTGVTRAKSGLMLWGSAAAVRMACGRSGGRFSSIPELLAERGGAG